MFSTSPDLAMGAVQTTIHGQHLLTVRLRCTLSITQKALPNCPTMQAFPYQGPAWERCLRFGLLQTSIWGCKGHHGLLTGTWSHADRTCRHAILRNTIDGASTNARQHLGQRLLQQVHISPCISSKLSKKSRMAHSSLVFNANNSRPVHPFTRRLGKPPRIAGICRRHSNVIVQSTSQETQVDRKAASTLECLPAI